MVLETYIFTVLAISLVGDYFIWNHFSRCFEMQYELTNKILANYVAREEGEIVHPTTCDCCENDDDALKLLFSNKEKANTTSQDMLINHDMTGMEVMQTIKEEE